MPVYAMFVDGTATCCEDVRSLPTPLSTLVSPVVGAELRELFLKCTWVCDGPRVAKTVLKKNKKSLSDTKT